MEEFKLNSFDGTEIACYAWDDVESPIGVVQIAHGMGEHCKRYNDFAKYLNANGFIVVAEDHRGHGQTSGFDRRGMVDGDSYNDTVQDMIGLTSFASTKYKLPIVLVGHSYGSFLSQAYIQRNGGAICGCILSGSAYMGTGLVAFGRLIAKIQKAILGGDKPAKLIANLSFGAYDKQFKSENLPFAWLTRDKKVIEEYKADPFCGAAYTMSIGFQKSFFCGLKKIYTNEALEAIPKTLPVLVTSGDQDPVGTNGKMVSRLFEEYKAHGVNAQIKLYPGCRHEILNELNKKEVYSDFLTFINGAVEAVKPKKTAKKAKADIAEQTVVEDVVSTANVEETKSE